MKKVFTTCILALIIFISMAACTNALSENGLIETILETLNTEPTIETEPEYTFFNPKSIFLHEYINDEEVIPHILFTPSISDESRPKPLIVWLHGSGERDADKLDFLLSGLPLAINVWLTDGFDAYILCPHLTGKWNSGVWHDKYTADNLQALLDKFISEHNVDTNNVVIVGHSLGGHGALYMAHQLPEYFSKCVVLSGFQVWINISEITIPTIGYVGLRGYGESVGSVNYMNGYFARVFGEENVFQIPTSHGSLPLVVFHQDLDNNNRSDIIEWMFDGID
jgi:predicted esterase